MDTHPTDSNPWLLLLGTLTAVAALAGLILLGSASWDPGDRDYSPATIYLGSAIVGGALTMLAGTLVAGAVCWQLRTDARRVTSGS